MIDADELWERLKKSMIRHIVTNTLFNTIKATIDGTPTIDPVKHGKWLEDDSDYWLLECSECHATIDKESVFLGECFLNYCPHCGARMEGAEHEID